VASSLALASALHAQTPASSQDLAHPQGTNAGIFAFTARCAGCHDTGKNGATDRYTLNRHTPEEVLASITNGKMAPYAQELSEYERRVMAVYVGGRPLGAAALGDAARMKNRCQGAPAFALNDQCTHPLEASSEYTKPVSAPTNTRPPTTTGWPYAELPLGNPNAHFSASFGVSAAVRPGDV